MMKTDIKFLEMKDRLNTLLYFTPPLCVCLCMCVPMALRPDAGSRPPLTGLRYHTHTHTPIGHTTLDRIPLDE